MKELEQKGNTAEDDISSLNCDIEAVRTNLSMQRMDLKTLKQKMKDLQEAGPGRSNSAAGSSGLGPDVDLAQLSLEFAPRKEFDDLCNRFKAMDSKFESVKGMVTESATRMNSFENQLNEMYRDMNMALSSSGPGDKAAGDKSQESKVS